MNPRNNQELGQAFQDLKDAVFDIIEPPLMALADKLDWALTKFNDWLNDQHGRW